MTFFESSFTAWFKKKARRGKNKARRVLFLDLHLEKIHLEKNGIFQDVFS